MMESMNAQMWWYMRELQRKQAHLENDQQRVTRLLAQAKDRHTKLRLERELETIEIHLHKVKRGLLY